MLEIIPELNQLEADTLEMLLFQTAQHMRYEKAALELVAQERAKLEEEHEREIRALKLQGESEQTRSSVSAEMKLQALEEQAAQEQEQLRNEACEKIAELEEEVSKLENQLEEQKAKFLEAEEAHREECEKLQEEGSAILQAYEEAQSETELKRETSRKLKEEIIDNDRLTVANLNRIKNLESELDETRLQCEKLDRENDELREELSKSITGADENIDLQGEVEALREVLQEREDQLLTLKQRMASDGFFDRDRAPSFDRAPGSGSAAARRDSLLDRLGLGQKQAV